jgi:integrase
VVAGPGEVVSFHSWRHTFRTLLAKAGVAKATAQKLGGWTTDIGEDYNHHHAALEKAIQALP